MEGELFSARLVQASGNMKTEISFPTTKAKKHRMNTIPYRHSSEFPEDTIVKDRDHAGGYTTYYVFLNKTLVGKRRVYGKGPHYREVRQIRNQYERDLDGPKKHWNPLDYRTDGVNKFKFTVDLPAKFVEDN